jgi:hypothetical protein
MGTRPTKFWVDSKTIPHLYDGQGGLPWKVSWNLDTPREGVYERFMGVATSILMANCQKTFMTREVKIYKCVVVIDSLKGRF